MAVAVNPQDRHQYMGKLPENCNRWICIYPAYINKQKTIAEGRRIPKSKCVVAPTCKEITEALKPTGLPIYVEHKIYSREVVNVLSNWGRVRVQLKVNNDGEPLNPKFQKREDLFLYVAETIPKLKSRTNPKPQPNQPAQQGKQGKGKKKK